MLRKERLWATLKGEKVDRPPVCFYELNGYDENQFDPNPYNIYQDETWQELIQLTRDKTDRIVSRYVNFIHPINEMDKLTKITTYYDENGSLHEIKEIKAKNRVLRQHTRRDLDINTVWTLEHLLKDEEDLKEFIQLPHSYDVGIPDISLVLKTEEELGDTGIVIIEMGDALLEMASLFSMEDYTILAMMEPELFAQGMDIMQKQVLRKTEILSELLPERLWRIYGPEYATPPYLPPYLYQKYVLEYDEIIIKAIHENRGIARIHQHGNLKDVLSLVIETGCDGLDPIEPLPQGDVTLSEVREFCGEGFLLFGNLEINDIEMMSQEELTEKVLTAIKEGPDSNGSSFILMPSASPYGRKLEKKTVDNYKRIIEIVESLSHS